MVSVMLAPLGFASIEWHTDFEAAKKLAAEKDRPLFVEFTGSDWCIWCVRLNDEVFSKEEFQAFVRENFIMVKLDFPRNIEQSEAQRDQNRRLMQQYGVQGFPTILLMDPKGEVFARTGYRRGGPSSYVEHLKSELAKRS